MNNQAHTFSCSTSHLSSCYFNNAASKTLISRRNHFAVKGSLQKLNVMGRKMLLRPVNSGVIFPANWNWNRDGFLLNGVLGMNLNSCLMKNRGFAIHSVSKGQSSSTNVETKRKVVEHISLLKAKEDLSDEDEKDMLDFLYTTQYQMGGIIAISLGRLFNQYVGSYTHAVFMRFQRREDLEKFYENPFYLRVLKDHVTPYCHGITYVDYESEVEDDILSIFRKGEEFNFGVEFILLIQFAESSLGGTAEDALVSLAKLSTEFPSLIAQATQGSNFNLSSKEYTHGVVIRFRSSEAFKIFMGSSEYKDMWRSKFQPIIHKVLSINFLVDPVSLCNTASLIPRIQKEVILGPPWLVCSLKTSLRAPVVEVVELPAQKAPKNYAAITTEKKGKAVEGVREEPIDPVAEKHCQQRSSLLHPWKLQVSAPSSHSRSTGQRKFLLETVRSGVATSTFEHLGDEFGGSHFFIFSYPNYSPYF